MKDYTNEATRSERVLLSIEEKHTCSRGTENCCTHQATRREEDTGITSTAGGDRRKQSEKQGWFLSFASTVDFFVKKKCTWYRIIPTTT